MKDVFLVKSITYKAVALLLLVSLFSGCSIYKSKFECPAGKAASCQSSSKVNELVNNNELEDFIERQNCKSKSCKSSKVFAQNMRIEPHSDEWMRVYVNSYIDDSFVKHEPYILEFKIANK